LVIAEIQAMRIAAGLCPGWGRKIQDRVGGAEKCLAFVSDDALLARPMQRESPMEDETSREAPPLPLTHLGSANAPIVYFDGAPTFGFDGSIGNITLEAVIHVSTEDRVATERRVVAHLRMGAKGLASLKKAIEVIELMQSPAGGSSMN
jgi:hypothetical protein